MMETENLTGRASIRIRRSPSEVFAAFADAGSMSAFWFTRRDDGLKEGEPVTWYLGGDQDAYSFEVFVKELSSPNRIVIVWERDGANVEVTWSLAETDENDTILTIEESGFAGSREAIVEQALDSTGGFNQVIVAAKAFIEHGVELNVVADHA